MNQPTQHTVLIHPDQAHIPGAHVRDMQHKEAIYQMLDTVNMPERDEFLPWMNWYIYGYSRCCDRTEAYYGDRWTGGKDGTAEHLNIMEIGREINENQRYCCEAKVWPWTSWFCIIMIYVGGATGYAAGPDGTGGQQSVVVWVIWIIVFFLLRYGIRVFFMFKVSDRIIKMIVIFNVVFYLCYATTLTIILSTRMPPGPQPPPTFSPTVAPPTFPPS